MGILTEAEVNGLDNAWKTSRTPDLSEWALSHGERLIAAARRAIKLEERATEIDEMLHKVDRWVSILLGDAPRTVTDGPDGSDLRAFLRDIACRPAGLEPPEFPKHVGEVPARTTGALALLMTYGAERIAAEALRIDMVPAPGRHPIEDYCLLDIIQKLVRQALKQ